MVKKLMESIREQKKNSILAMVTISGEVVFEVIIPLLMANLIDYGIDMGDMGYIVKMGIVLLLSALGQLFCGAISGKFAAIASSGFARNLRHDMFYKVQNYSFSNIDKFSTASIVTRLTTDVTNLQNTYQMIIRMAIRSPLMAIFSLVAAFGIDAKLSLIFLAIIPVLILGLYFIMTRTHPIFERVFRTYDKLNSVVQENLHGIRVVKSFVREDHENKKFTGISENIYKDFKKAEQQLAWNAPLMQLCMYAAVLLLSWFGARTIVACGGDAATGLSTGELLSLLSYATQILMSLMGLSMIFVMLTMSRTSGERVVELLNETPDITTPENAVKSVPDGSIDFEHVQFSYRHGTEGKPVLSDINLHIPAGATVGVIGGTNVQWAHDPVSDRDIIIEINPRTSRSSALASKATGFPIALVSAMLASGLTLDEIPCGKYGTLDKYYPDGDYVVVKFARWAFEKFKGVSDHLGTQMRAVGEVMSIGNSFEAAMMKAVSSIELGMDTLTHKPFEELSDDEIVDHMHVQDAERVFCVYEALKRGIDHETIYRITKIDWWFLDKMQHLADLEKGLAKCEGVLSVAQYKEAKKYGFQDKTIKRLAKVDKLPVENYRAGFKMVDTCAAEFSANTPYFYSTYDGDNEAAEFIAEKEAKAAEKGEPRKKKVLVFGSGPIRIGQGIEFDYCSVHCVWTLKKHGCEAILVNNNPETVSTDFDTGDRLYFDPLNPESVDNIIATEKPDACVVQFGGQTAIKLAKHMDEIGLPILGTPADAIDEAEDRERFDELLERCNIPRAPGRTVFNLEEALAAADEIGLPVLMRPSYVLGGQNMIVAYTKADVIEYMGVITEHVDMDHPVLLDKYIMGTECEVDAICDGENYLIPGIMEQVERTGVHSGDSICVYPAQHLTQAEIDTMVDYTGRFARELHVTGLVNVQYAVSNGKVYVIEVNPRSSRTVPYISKVTGVPMVDLAVRCCLGEKLTDMGYGTGLHPNAPYVAVKVPVFSFEKLHGVDTQFGPEMKSTGEVLGIAPNFHDALLKGLIGAGYTFKTPGPASCCIFTVKDSDKPEFVDIAWKLKSMGYKLYGTSGTCAWLNKHMVPCNEVRNMSGEAPNIVDLLQSGLVDYVFSTSAKGRDPKRDSVRLRRKAVELSIPCITAVDTANALVDCLRSDHSMKDIPLVDIATLYHKK